MTNEDSQILIMTSKISKKIMDTSIVEFTWAMVILTTGQECPNALPVYKKDTGEFMDPLCLHKVR